MQRILCYGDSNTWGHMPVTGVRYAADVRWTGVVQKLLGADYTILEEGLNGRTTVWDDPVREYMNGLEYIGPCLLSQYPLDLVIIMLGTNDLKQRFHLNAWSIAEGIKCLVDEVKKNEKKDAGSGCPKILIVSPIHVADEIDDSPFALEFESQGTCDISHQLATEMSRVAKDAGCYFMNAAEYAKPSKKDSLHMEPEDHKALGEAMAKKIREILE